MHAGRIVFSQILDFMPKYEFNKCVQRYQGNYRIRKFSCYDQFLCMAFAQLTYRESLRDIETCLHALQKKLYHTGLRSTIARSTLAEANENRDWHIYADFAQILIRRARLLYAQENFGVTLKQAAYAFDSTTVDLCLSLFPWAQFRRHKAAIKIHTLLDLRGGIPCFIRVTSGKVHDVRLLDELTLEPGSFYIMDRAYTDFRRLYTFTQNSAFFIVRAKSNLDYTRRSSRPVKKSTGLKSDQTIVLVGPKTSSMYPDSLRRISYFDSENQKRLVFLTNNFALPPLTIAKLYRCRWQVELFFKWIKQHLRIKAFYGTSENAIKTQIWIAISIYVLVAIIKKELQLERSLNEILQILSITLFEKSPINQALSGFFLTTENHHSEKQLFLFNF
jgi:transposase